LPGTADLLGRLATLPNVQVAVVSGRRAEEISSLVPASGIYYVGLHGAEILWPDGRRSLAEGIEHLARWLEQARCHLDHELSQLEGVWIEDKRYALACHVRLATETARVAAASAVRKVHDRLCAEGAPLELLEGHCVYELRMRGVHKGNAALRLLATFRADALPMYAGDDATDEDAFRVLPSNAVTIRVSACDVPTAARYRVETPETLSQLLKALVEARSSTAGSSAQTSGQ
jgi:trehalose-phosphatase